ncbi:transposase [Pseudorhodobacter turbinis]|uniref:Transposase n=1 Tax=Pseudorhodobacter turbinis TaxID=2500533 RepID=A0A4P8EDH0_9RHOB|nr:transposase [Pseudorhodobacter turbinis]
MMFPSNRVRIVSRPSRWTSARVMTVWQRLSKTSCARTRSRVARQAICKANLPRGGTVFVFRSKRADRMKLLYWDGTGLVMAYKRLVDHHLQGHPVDILKGRERIRSAAAHTGIKF